MVLRMAGQRVQEIVTVCDREIRGGGGMVKYDALRQMSGGWGLKMLKK